MIIKKIVIIIIISHSILDIIRDKIAWDKNGRQNTQRTEEPNTTNGKLHSHQTYFDQTFNISTKIRESQ